MPNWTDDEGRNHFGKIDCKRCLGEFIANENGEVPTHKCLGGHYTSGFDGLYHHAPIKVSESNKNNPNDFVKQALATICANKAVTLTRKELNLFAKETGMIHLAAWGGWKISYQKIAPDVYSVKLGERFQNEE